MFDRGGTHLDQARRFGARFAGENGPMTDQATIRRPQTARTPGASFPRRERRATPVFMPPADAPVLQGTRGPIRVATAEHHDPKTYS